MLEIRKATPEDAAQLLAYLNQIGGESDNLLFGANEIPPGCALRRFLCQTYGSPSKSCCDLFSPKQPAASFDGSSIANLSSFGNKAFLEARVYSAQSGVDIGLYLRVRTKYATIAPTKEANGHGDSAAL